MSTRQIFGLSLWCSGFNIGSNFTIDARFNGLVGFSETELRAMLGYYREQGMLKMSVEKVIQEIKPWYDNYCFSDECLDEPMYNSDMVLYYFGLLSIQGVERGDAILAIPNHTVREQIYSYLVEAYAESDVFRIDFYQLGQLMKDMAYTGDWQPVFNYIASELEKQSRIREFIDGEAHIKGFLLAYLGMTNYYILLPEYEMAKGFADFYFQPNPRLMDIPYVYLLEVKYMKRDEPDSRIAILKEEARAQLLRYASDEVVTSALGNAKLRLISVVFRGWEIVAMEE